MISVGEVGLLQSPATAGVLQTCKHFGICVLAVLQQLCDTHYSGIHSRKASDCRITPLLKEMPASTIVFGTHGNANYKRVCVYKGILLKSYTVVL